MPKRNPVPSLKLLCIRALVWPDDLETDGSIKHKSEMLIRPKSKDGSSQSIPKQDESRSSKLSITSLLFGFGRNKSQQRAEKSDDLPNHISNWLISVPGLNDAIINAWIRLSNYYGTRINQLNQMNKFLLLQNISTLDLLHEGFKLRNGVEWSEIGHLLPTTIAPHAINPEEWCEIFHVLQLTGNVKNLLNLSASFTITEGQSITSFNFSTTFSQFQNLISLVVSGIVSDEFLRIIGKNCSNLCVLDIRGCSNVSENGVLLLLFSKVPTMEVMSAVNPLILENVRRPLTKTLKYVDLSTIPRKTSPDHLSKIIPIVCPYLRPTPTRLFFLPPGITGSHYHIDKRSIDDLRLTILTDIKVKCLELFLSFIDMMRNNFHLGVTEVELRTNQATGQECGLLFLQLNKIAMHLTLENLTVLALTTFTSSSFDFIPLEMLASSTPCLRNIKASLKGQLTSERTLFDLKSVSSAIMYSKETLKSIIHYSFELEYLEVREIFLSEYLNDSDIHEMMLNGPYPSFEVFRLLFRNRINLSPGIKELVINCPNLKVLSDFKYYSAITFDTLSKFVLNMSKHNFEMLFEYDGILYPTNSQCKEFHR